MSGYGLSSTNPVLCGGGPPVEHDYLKRLRCPAGKSVTFQREGSDALETRPDYVSSPDVRFFVGGSGLAQGATQESILNPLHIDGYRVSCKCGKHSQLVWMDMYHRGPERVIDVPDWKLTRDTPLDLQFPVVWVKGVGDRVSKASFPEQLSSGLYDEWESHMRFSKPGGFFESSQIIDARGNGYMVDVVLADTVTKRFLLLFRYKSTSYRLIGIRPSRKYSAKDIKALMLVRLRSVISNSLGHGYQPSREDIDKAESMVRGVSEARTVDDAIRAYPHSM